MTRSFIPTTLGEIQKYEVRTAVTYVSRSVLFLIAICILPIFNQLTPFLFFLLGCVPVYAVWYASCAYFKKVYLEMERNKESSKRGGSSVLGSPPDRTAIVKQLEKDRSNGKKMVSRYLVGFELETGEAMWVSDDDLCSHACVFAKTGVGKTLWLESLMMQQMARGRASGLTFIDAKRDSGTLAHIIMMALVSGRIEDLVVIDPFEPIHSYNFVLTTQRSDVKARKVLRAGIPPMSDSSEAKHYDRLAADSIYRMVRAMESTGLSWSMKDVAVSLSAFLHAYPHLHSMLERVGAQEAQVELGHLFASYADGKGGFNTVKMGDNLRGIASELHAIGGSEIGQIFTTKYTDLVLTADILKGKIIYYMLPRLEEAESAGRMVKIFREDLEISIGEITSSRQYNLEDPHLVIVDEGSSTFGPTWANLFELARKGRFAILFGAQSTGGLTDQALGLSEAFYERVMANVNLKVMMRIGDNKTAAEMALWIGMGKSLKASYASGKRHNPGLANEFIPGMSGKSATLTVSEEEVEVVSEDELKHEMSAEKGLAWFDLGDGTIRKGRSLWFYADLPKTWEGREYLTRYERQESDGIGLAEWVDSKILSDEKARLSKPPGQQMGGQQGGQRQWNNQGGNNNQGNNGPPTHPSRQPVFVPSQAAQRGSAQTAGSQSEAGQATHGGVVPSAQDASPETPNVPFKASKLPRGGKNRGVVTVVKK
jgi:hypothetical protein